jgi:DNA repair exonuclease SbcCD ATPase subunit
MFKEITMTTTTPEHRDAVMRAAEAFDATQKQITGLQDQLKQEQLRHQEQLHKAIAGLEERSHQIEELKLLLAQERNNAASYRAECDQARADRSDVLAVLANFQAILDRFEGQLAMPPHRARKKNGGKHVEAATIPADEAIDPGTAA